MMDAIIYVAAALTLGVSLGWFSGRHEAARYASAWKRSARLWRRAALALGHGRGPWSEVP